MAKITKVANSRFPKATPRGNGRTQPAPTTKKSRKSAIGMTPSSVNTANIK